MICERLIAKLHIKQVRVNSEASMSKCCAANRMNSTHGHTLLFQKKFSSLINLLKKHGDNTMAL